MYFIILNTNDEQFTLTTKKTLHLIFKNYPSFCLLVHVFCCVHVIAASSLQLLVSDLGNFAAIWSRKMSEISNIKANIPKIVHHKTSVAQLCFAV